jgi:hypothetical protein
MATLSKQSSGLRFIQFGKPRRSIYLPAGTTLKAAETIR